MILHESRQDPGSSGIDKNDIVLELDDIHELFIAPEVDPFSERVMEYMGHSALERMIRNLSPGWTLRAPHWRLILRLPAGQITPELPDQVKKAICRFCRTKLNDNRIQLKNIRWNGIRKLPTSFLFLAICIGLGSLFGSGTIAAIPAWLGETLSEGMTIIGWVSLTYPAETLLLQPIPIRRENKILAVLMDIPFIIESRQ